MIILKSRYLVWNLSFIYKIVATIRTKKIITTIPYWTNCATLFCSQILLVIKVVLTWIPWRVFMKHTGKMFNLAMDIKHLNNSWCYLLLRLFELCMLQWFRKVKPKEVRRFFLLISFLDCLKLYCKFSWIENRTFII